MNFTSPREIVNAEEVGRSATYGREDLRRARQFGQSTGVGHDYTNETIERLARTRCGYSCIAIGKCVGNGGM